VKEHNLTQEVCTEMNQWESTPKRAATKASRERAPSTDRVKKHLSYQHRAVEFGEMLGRKISQGSKTDLRCQSATTDGFRGWRNVPGLFKDCHLDAIHTKRITIKPKDFHPVDSTDKGKV
ncbi:histone H3.3C, partial [Galemys pyrenaicus]